MVYGYHVIFSTYGFRLPNDPRGSWSDFVGSWELFRFGKSTRHRQRCKLTERDEQRRRAAKAALKFPAVQLSGVQARAVARGFATSVRKSGFLVWACSILPEHVHLVIARHRFAIKKVANSLKGEATKRLLQEGLHPLAGYCDWRGDRPSPWARGQWAGYLDTQDVIEQAIGYVEQNPIKEGKKPQSWSFVTPFSGIEPGWVSY